MEFFLVVVVGLAGGFMVNYLSDVLPVLRKLVHPQCMRCNHSYTWIDYALLRRCGHCQARRTTRAWIIQLGMPILALYFLLLPPGRLGTWVGLLVAMYLILVVVIDIEHRLVLHPVSLFGIAAGAVLGWQLHGLTSMLLGGLFGFGSMLAFYFLGDWYAHWTSKKRGQEYEDSALGFGDVMLSAVIGVSTGWPQVVGALLLGILLGGVFSAGYVVVQLIRKKYSPMAAIAYAPFLALACAIFLFLPK